MIPVIFGSPLVYVYIVKVIYKPQKKEYIFQNTVVLKGDPWVYLQCNDSACVQLQVFSLLLTVRNASLLL
jgi:hypothetical protein